MNEIFYNKMKKIEYFFFIKKIKKNIYVKRQIRKKISFFQKKIAVENLLINVVNSVKRDILNEKIKQILCRKFLFKVIEQYIEHYKENGNNTNQYIINNNEYQINKRKKLEQSKKIFKQYIIQKNIYYFLNGASICINNQRLKNIRNNYIISKRIDNIRLSFMKLKQLKLISLSKNIKIIMCKIFFIEIKRSIFHSKKDKNINLIKELDKQKKLFIFKNGFHRFLDKCRSNIRNEKILEERVHKYNDNIKDLKNKEIKRNLKIFINKIKIIKKTNKALKRKIFNLFKNNAKVSKDLKYYLNEANNLE
jgi:hypothetical protein